MVTARQWRLISWLLKLGLWEEYTHLWTQRVRPQRGTRWLYEWIKKRQVVDDLHHAPACPANHWHRMVIVFLPCNCGAAYYAEQEIQTSVSKSDTISEE